MTTSTFLVALTLQDASPESLAGQAELIQESLEHDGLPVVSVKPWSQHGMAPAATPDLPGPLDAAAQRTF